MCLYPKLLKNRKYIANKKNGGIIPQVKDDRCLWVPVGCGKCMECLKQKGRNWSVRLQEEIRENKNGVFITLTFSDESLEELGKNVEYKVEGYDRENDTAKLGVRRFLERWRKKYKKSVRHWLVTELGERNTERIHIHGILWTNEETETIKKIWKYGEIWIGEYVNEKTINYIVKYIYKTDKKHKEYTPIILTSKGIGSGYLKRKDSKLNKYKDKDTDETYKTRQGIKLGMPTYYRNKIYSDQEREKLWINMLDKEERYVNGVKITIKNGDEDYYKALKRAKTKNNRLGYGNDEKNWEREKYEKERRNIIKKERRKKLKGN